MLADLMAPRHGQVLAGLVDGGAVVVIFRDYSHSLLLLVHTIISQSDQEARSNFKVPIGDDATFN